MRNQLLKFLQLVRRQQFRSSADAVQRGIKPLQLAFREVFQNVRNHQILAAWMSDADPHAQKFSADMPLNRFQSVVAAASAAGLRLHFAGRKIDLVVDDDDIAAVELEIPRRFPDRLTGIVHESLGLQKADALASEPTFRKQALKLRPPTSETAVLRDLLHCAVSDIVAVSRIFRARISEAYKQFQLFASGQSLRFNGRSRRQAHPQNPMRRISTISSSAVPTAGMRLVQSAAASSSDSVFSSVSA